MKRFVEGEDRRQAYLLPESLEDYVSEDNPVRWSRCLSTNWIWGRWGSPASSRR